MESITTALQVDTTHGAALRGNEHPMPAYTSAVTGITLPSFGRVRGTAVLTDVDGHQACAPPD